MEEVKFLILTIAIEVPISMACMPKGVRNRVAVAGFLANCVTHPLAWIAVTRGAPWIAVEIAVTAVEMAIFSILFATDRRRALLSAFAMNLISAAIGAFFL